MPSTRDIRRRIKSVRNTAQITKAMQMVAAAKMRKAQQAALAGRPYASLLNQVLGEVTRDVHDFTHPWLEMREFRAVGERCLIVVSTDKGLCGSLNTNLLREAAKFDRETTRYIAVGRKAAQFIARTKRQLAAEFTYKDTPLFSEARAIAKFAARLFTEEEVDRVDILYTRFISTLSQRPELMPLLPMRELPSAGAGLAEALPPRFTTGPTEYLFEPSAGQVFGALLPHCLNFNVYQILLEAKASEQSARMVAMKNATDNAGQLIRDLTLEYNKMRQAAITNELLEIATAAMAME